MNLAHSHKSERFVGKVISIGEFKKEIQLNDEKYYRHFIKTKLHVGDNIVLTITNRKPKRTENQNRYYWMFLGIISDETGYTPEELHEWAKGTCLPSEIKEILGSKVRLKTSTTDLSVSQFIEYVIDIEKKTGIPAPDTREWGLAPLR